MPRHSEFHQDEVIVLGVLDAVERNSSITQRHVASELGIAVGLANAYVKRCVRKGLIKVSQAPARRYAYYLTPKGFAEKSRLTASFLSDSLSFFRRAREQCSELLDGLVAAGARRAVLIGAGDLADIVRLLALERSFEIVAVVEPVGTERALLDAVPTADYYVITSLDRGRELHDAAVRKYGKGRVVAPALLRLGGVDSLRAAEG